jgi:hypothetical protein
VAGKLIQYTYQVTVWETGIVVENNFFQISNEFEQSLKSTQQPVRRVTETFWSEKKRPGRQADSSIPYRAKVKNVQIHIFTPPYATLACTGATFTLIFVIAFSPVKVGLLWFPTTVVSKKCFFSNK